MRFTLFALVATLAFASSSVRSADDPDSADGKKFYVTAPSCKSYRCQTQVTAGTTMHLNWLNPTGGKINIRLVPEPDQKGLETVKVVDGLAANAMANKCDKAGQASCGMYDWAIPSSVKPGNYSIDIRSLYSKGLHGYSDIVTVLKSKKAAAVTPAKSTTKKDETTKKDATKKSTKKTTKNDSTKKTTSKKSSNKKDTAKKTTAAKKDTAEKKDSTKKTASKRHLKGGQARHVEAALI